MKYTSRQWEAVVSSSSRIKNWAEAVAVSPPVCYQFSLCSCKGGEKHCSWLCSAVGLWQLRAHRCDPHFPHAVFPHRPRRVPAALAPCVPFSRNLLPAFAVPAKGMRCQLSAALLGRQVGTTRQSATYRSPSAPQPSARHQRQLCGGAAVNGCGTRSPAAPVRGVREGSEQPRVPAPPASSGCAPAAGKQREGHLPLWSLCFH